MINKWKIKRNQKEPISFLIKQTANFLICNKGERRQVHTQKYRKHPSCIKIKSTEY